MLHPIVINENGKRKTIYRKLWDVSYNRAKRLHEAWIRYKGQGMAGEAGRFGMED